MISRTQLLNILRGEGYYSDTQNGHYEAYQLVLARCALDYECRPVFLKANLQTGEIYSDHIDRGVTDGETFITLGHIKGKKEIINHHLWIHILMEQLALVYNWNIYKNKKTFYAIYVMLIHSYILHLYS